MPAPAPAPAPRQYRGTPGQAVWTAPDAALQRSARLAARRSFVGVKQRFLEAVAGLPGARGDWLRHQVRHANEPLDLWLLRGAVYAALRTTDQANHGREVALDRALDSVFPDTTSGSTHWGA